MKIKHERKPPNLSDGVFIIAMSAALGLGLPGRQQEGTGAVDSRQSIVRALQIARASQNVKSVENSLAVKGAK